MELNEQEQWELIDFLEASDYSHNNPRCIRCNDAGVVPTEGHESHLGAQEKPCPQCTKPVEESSSGTK